MRSCISIILDKGHVAAFDNLQRTLFPNREIEFDLNSSAVYDQFALFPLSLRTCFDNYFRGYLSPNSIGLGVGGDMPFDAKLSEKCSHNYYTTLIKQISLFDTALHKYLKLQFKIKEINL